MDRRVKTRAIPNTYLGFVSPERSVPFVPEHERTSDSHFKQRLVKQPKLRRPCSRKARGAPGFPSPRLTRGNAPSPKVRGAERPKARVDISTPCGARPVT